MAVLAISHLAAENFTGSACDVGLRMLLSFATICILDTFKAWMGLLFTKEEQFSVLEASEAVKVYYWKGWRVRNRVRAACVTC